MAVPTEQTIGTILIVDDEAIIRGMLEVELAQRYNVYTADSAEQAFSILRQHRVDLAISDINMPGMKGFEFLDRVRRDYPHTKTALITAYNIDDYVRMAKQSDISNIISKSTPFNFDEFNSIVYNLVTEKIFGLERYMLPDYALVASYRILDSAQIAGVEDEILQSIASFAKPQPFVQILLEELISNAVYHAPVDADGKEKYEKHTDVTLEESEAVEVSLGKDSEKYGVSVVDTSGKLTKQQVLYRIDRHVHGEGLLDESGRGIHMSRMYADRLIINIRKDTTTEAVFLNYFDEKYKGFKPLYINEV
ncbi:MAG: response regulator [Chitinivibrionales bacterium]|nr:response regulator [Chitinivibrionales bacterium]MBD3396919.1 response regulator [Chitinivibrionales bacterium]